MRKVSATVARAQANAQLAASQKRQQSGSAGPPERTTLSCKELAARIQTLSSKKGPARSMCGECTNSIP